MAGKPGRPAATFDPVDPDPTPEQLCEQGVFSLRRAARFCGMSMDAMRKAVSLRVVPSFKLGGRRVIARRELVRYLAAAMSASLSREGT